MKIDNFIDCQICPSIQEQWLCGLELNQNLTRTLKMYSFLQNALAQKLFFTVLYIWIYRIFNRTVLEPFQNFLRTIKTFVITYSIPLIFFDFLKLNPQCRFHILQCVDHLLLYSSAINQFILLIDKHHLQESNAC